MNAFLGAVLLVFFGFLIGCLFAAGTNRPYTHFEMAKQVCETANSTPVSLDWEEFICANGGVFPYKVNK